MEKLDWLLDILFDLTEWMRAHEFLTTVITTVIASLVSIAVSLAMMPK